MTTRALVISHNARFDLSPVAEFGELVYVLEQGDIISPFRTQELLSKIEERLTELQFDPANDKLVITGNGTQLALLMLAVSDTADEIMLLIYDAAHERYVERKVQL